MARYQAIVDFLLNVSETGTELPAKLRNELDQLTQSSGGAAQSLSGKFGQALSRLERREPTLALQSMRYAMGSLAAEALGTAGPVGRVVSSVGLLVPNAFLATGGVIGLTAAISKIVAPTNAAITAGEKLRDSWIKQADDVGKLNAALTDLASSTETTTKWGERLVAALAALPGGEAIGRGVGAFLGSRLSKAGQLAGELPEDFNKKIDQSNQAFLESLRQHIALIGLSTRQTAELRAFQTGHGGVADQAGALAVLGEQLQDQADRQKTLNEATDEWAAIGERAAAVALDWGNALSRISVGLPRAGLRPAPDQSFDLGDFLRQGAIFQNASELASRMSNRLGKDLSSLGNAATYGGGADRGRIGAIIAASLSGIGGVAGGGGVGAALSGVGGVLSAIPAAGDIAGPLLAGIGGLVSIFTSGSAKVTISDFEQQAVDRMKNLIQFPTTTSSNFLGGSGSNAREAANAAARFGARNGVVTVAR
jgi:hypothetical protein